MPFAEWSLACLDMQGYRLSREQKQRSEPAIKFTPALCTVLTVLFVALQWPLGLWALAGTALVGALLPRHVFDYLYGVLLSRPLKTGWAPPNPPQRRFACTGAALMLGAGAWLIGGGAVLAGSAVALAFAAIAGVMAVTNWCLPSFIYNRIPGLPGRV